MEKEKNDKRRMNTGDFAHFAGSSNRPDGLPIAPEAIRKSGAEYPQAIRTPTEPVAVIAQNLLLFAFSSHPPAITKPDKHDK
jgi:hypothetical protein